MTEPGHDCEQPAPRPALALLAAAPYLVLQVVFLSDTHGWSVALSYGLVLTVLPALLLGWAILLVLELRTRRRLQARQFRVPAFSLVGLCFLLAFFHLGVWLRPLVLLIPRWCRVSQIVQRSTAPIRMRVTGTYARGTIPLNWRNERERD